MRIERTAVELTQTDLARGIKDAAGSDKKGSAAQPAAPVQRGDSVQISDAGRALSAQQPEKVGAARGELSAERVAEVRQRILGGAYNSVEVVEEVARRMLERGDI